MSRFAAIILLILALAGTFTPCCPDDCAGDASFAECGTTGTGNDKGVCSPFFACPGCAISIEIPVSELPASPVTTQATHYCSYTLQGLVDFHSRLFQPPRNC